MFSAPDAIKNEKRMLICFWKNNYINADMMLLLFFVLQPSIKMATGFSRALVF